jgi:hypothetical protein
MIPDNSIKVSNAKALLKDEYRLNRSMYASNEAYFQQLLIYLNVV